MPWHFFGRPFWSQHYPGLYGFYPVIGFHCGQEALPGGNNFHLFPVMSLYHSLLQVFFSACLPRWENAVWSLRIFTALLVRTVSGALPPEVYLFRVSLQFGPRSVSFIGTTIRRQFRLSVRMQRSSRSSRATAALVGPRRQVSEGVCNLRHVLSLALNTSAVCAAWLRWDVTVTTLRSAASWPFCSQPF